jgi:hypothetical protein
MPEQRSSKARDEQIVLIFAAVPCEFGHNDDLIVSVNFALTEHSVCLLVHKKRRRLGCIGLASGRAGTQSLLLPLIRAAPYSQNWIVRRPHGL